MARLQILELPEGSGDDRPPFILVIDQVATGPDGELLLKSSDFESVNERLGARAVLVFEETIDIPANDTSAYAVGGPLPETDAGPVFTSPLTGIEVRQPCPYCGDGRMIPRTQFAEHVAQLHPDESATDA